MQSGEFHISGLASPPDEAVLAAVQSALAQCTQWEAENFAGMRYFPRTITLTDQEAHSFARDGSLQFSTAQLLAAPHRDIATALHALSINYEAMEIFGRKDYHPKMTADFMRRLNVCDPDNPGVQKITTHLQSVAADLLRASGHDPLKEKTRIFLFRDSRYQALYEGGDPPLIGVNIDVLAAAPDMDSIAHSLGHELTHYLIPHTNSKLQEMAAQAYGLRLIAKAGFNPRVVIDHHRNAPKQFAQDSRHDRTFEDDHAAAAYDLREMENVLAYTERTEGKHYDHTSTPVPTWLHGECAQVPPKSYLPGTIDMAHFWARFNAADRTQKIKLTSSLLDLDVPQEDYDKAFAQLQLDLQNPESVAAFDALVLKCISKDASNHTSPFHYYDMASILYLQAQGKSSAEISAYEEKLEHNAAQNKQMREKAGPQFAHDSFARIKIGPLQNVEQALQQFWASSTVEDARKHAATFCAAGQKVGSVYYSFLSKYDFELPVLPSTADIDKQITQHGHYTPPYARFVTFFQQTKDMNLLSVLVTMGMMVDPWVSATAGSVTNVGPEIFANSIDLRSAEFGVPLNYDARLLSHQSVQKTLSLLTRDANGSATSMAQVVVPVPRRNPDPGRSKAVEPLFEYSYASLHALQDYERQWLDDRRVWEEGLVATADWSLLRTDFRQFIRHYHMALAPVIGLEDSTFPFAENFIQHIEAILKESDTPTAKKLREELPLFVNGFGDGVTPSFQTYIAEVLTPAKHAVRYNKRIDSEEKTSLFGQFHPNHPLINFIVRNKHHLFSQRQQLDLLDTTRLFTQDVRPQEAKLHYSPQNIYPTMDLHPDTFPQLLAAHDLMPDHGEYDYTLANILTLNYLIQTREKTTPAQMAVCKSGRWHTAFDRYVSHSIEDLNAERMQADFSDCLSLKDKCDYYILCNGLNLLDNHPNLRAEMAADIAQAITNPNCTPAEINQAAAKLVRHKNAHVSIPGGENSRDAKSHYLTYRGIIEDPALRLPVVKTYAQLMAKKLGKDDGSPAYIEKMTELLRKTKRDVSSQVYGYLLPELAHYIEAQPRAAYAMRDAFVTFGVDTVMAQQTAGKYSEFFTTEITKDARTRDAVTAFLTKPYSASSGELMLNQLKSAAQKSNTASAFFYSNTGTISEHGQQAVMYFHKNFWAAPVEARIWYLEKLLFPVQETRPTAHNDVVRRIVDQVLPLQHQQAANDNPSHWRDEPSHWRERPDTRVSYREIEPVEPIHKLPALDRFFAKIDRAEAAAEQQKKYGFDQQSIVFARAIVEAYLSVIPVREQRLLATTMLVTDGTGAATGTPSAGKTLYLVLSQMGPAGTKLLQAIHHHPQTPASLKAELSQCQTQHQMPFRWDLISWLEQAGAITPGDPLEVKHIGPELGGASLGVAVKNTLPDGRVVADTLLRPHAAPQAQREFTNMIAAIDKMVVTHPELEIVRDMVKEAKRSIEIETDFGLSKKLNQAATQAFEGISIKVREGNKTYHFTNHVSPISQANERMKRAELVTGEHFIDLPETTAAERSYKRAAAKAVFATVLGVRLAGLPADRDRHGGNVKVEGQTIGHFDTGAQELLMPTTAQKRALGKVLGSSLQQTFLAMQSGKPVTFDQIIVKEMEHADEDPIVRAFLAGVKREFLATGDYRSVSHKNRDLELNLSDIKDVLGTLIRQNAIDPEIMQGFKSGLGPLFMPAMQLLNSSPDNGAIQIDGLRKNVAAYKAVELTEKELALATPDTSIYTRTPDAAAAQQGGAGPSAVQTPQEKAIAAFIASPAWKDAVADEAARVLPWFMNHIHPKIFKKIESAVATNAKEHLAADYFRGMYETYRRVDDRYILRTGNTCSPHEQFAAEFPTTWPLFKNFCEQDLETTLPQAQVGGYVERLLRERGNPSRRNSV